MDDLRGFTDLSEKLKEDWDLASNVMLFSRYIHGELSAFTQNLDIDKLPYGIDIPVLVRPSSQTQGLWR